MLYNVIFRAVNLLSPSYVILSPSHPFLPLPSLSCLQSLPCSPSVNTSTLQTLQPFKLYATLSPFDFISIDLPPKLFLLDLRPKLKYGFPF